MYKRSFTTNSKIYTRLWILDFGFCPPSSPEVKPMADGREQWRAGIYELGD
jgi:hypothetical protein